MFGPRESVPILQEDIADGTVFEASVTHNGEIFSFILESIFIIN
jgi:hypothetical protein